MKRILIVPSILAALFVLPNAARAHGQESRPVSERQEAKEGSAAAQSAFAIEGDRLPRENEAAVPRVVKFTGVLLDAEGKALSGEVEVTFALYKQEGDEVPLWTETQRVTADEKGGYTALLGATQASGMPAEVFRSDEARWLGVQVQGQPQRPRTILVSVPYALKAVEAEKLSGKSLSDFVLSDSLGDQVRRVMEGQTIIAKQATSTGTVQPGQAKANSTVSSQTTTPAGPMFPPSTFSGTNSTQIVSVNQQGTGAGLASLTTSPNAAAGFFLASNTTGTASGVLGVTNNPGGAGVIGVTNATSVGANGVYGKSTSTGGSGVFGDATATSGFTHGVTGQTVSPDGIGVVGVENATTGFNSGVSGRSASANGTGVFGSSFQWVGVGGQATAPSGGPAFGVWGDSLSTNGVGVAGFEDATSGPTIGVQGNSVSPQGTGVVGVNNSSTGGVGVSGFANGTSGFGNGVLGQTASTTQYASGVVGFATASTGGVFGVSGTSDSNSGTGVNGYASSATGSTIGVGGFANSDSGSGVLAFEGSPTGQVYGVWGGTSSTSGSGVAGFNFSATGNTNGVYGQSYSTNGAGVVGIDNANSGFNEGVYGQSSSTSGAGVSGHALATSGGSAGVVGENISTGGSGVSGYNRATSGTTAGITGQVFSPNGIAGLFSNVPGQGLLLQGLSGPNFVQVFSVDANGNLHIAGNLVVDGTKSSVAKLQSGRQVALYAVESPENWFEDFGSAELKGGVAWVPLEGAFSEATNTTVSYHVFLTPNGDSNGLYVARKTATGFEVREHGGGGSSVAFDYRIVVRRRGYEALRMAEVPERKTEESQHLFNVANPARKEMAPVKIAPPRPTTQPVAPRPSVPQIPKMNVPQLPRGNK